MNRPTYRFVACTLVLAAVVSCAQTGDPPLKRLQAALDKRVKQYKVQGASAAVIFPDGTIWRGVSGISHPGVEMSAEMAFAIGSITKNMVAVLMLQLAEEGKLSLEDPIGKWLPSYPHVNPAITIRQMLNHTSGLFMFWENQALWDDLIRYRTKHFTPEEVLGYLKEPPFRPGEGYQYSNTGYLLAAMIITRVTGTTLAAEMRKRFWEPLDLRSARLPLEDPYPENLAHVWGDNFEKDGSCRDITFLPRVSHDSITYGSAGVFMTAEDLARWTHALFRGKVIGEDSLRQMQSFGRGAYGLGLGRFGFQVGGGLTALGHGGANIGTGAYMVHLPDYDVSIAVMVNRTFSGCDTRIAQDLSRITALSLTRAAYLDFLWSPLGALGVVWMAAALGATTFGVRKDKPLTLVVFGALAAAAGWVASDKWPPLDSVLFAIGGIVGMLGLVQLVRRPWRSLRPTVLAILALHLALVGAPAQLPVVPENVKTTVRQRVDYGYCPGMVVGLMNTNGTTYFGYGSVHLDGGPAVDENTLFEIGSITKVFTTTLLADMAGRGELELDQAIQVHLPDGITAPTWFDQPITLAHLATHTSGLPSAPSNLAGPDANNPFAGYSAPQMYEFLGSYTLTRAPGAAYGYSNYGMGLLGQLLARTSGIDYPALVATRITEELGLTETCFDLTPVQQTRRAQGYSGVVPIPPFEMDALEAAGDLRSTAKDLLTFLAANRGWLATRLQPAMAEAQRYRYSTGTPGLSVGLGWHLYTLGTGTAIWHNGATIGQRAFAGFLRNGRTLVVALANSDFDVTDIGFHLLDPAVPLTPVRRPAAVPETTLRHYVGRYESGVGDRFSIRLYRSHLIVEHGSSPGRFFTLHPSGANRFYLTFPDASAFFQTNSLGHATALAWTQSGTTATYPKVRVPSSLGLQRVDGVTQLTLSGDTDRDYVIQASANLAEWIGLSTNTIWDGPVLDPESKHLGLRFYRVLEP